MLIIVLLLVGSILLIIFSQRCPPKPKLVWYEKEIIYEIDVTTFRDSDGNGFGDIKGLTIFILKYLVDWIFSLGVGEKLNYFEKNNIKSLLLRSSIFNITSGTSLQLDRRNFQDKKFDFLTIDPLVGSENDFQDLAKLLNRKDMHLILDLPLSSTSDPNGYSWYGSINPLKNKINVRRNFFF